MATINRNRFIKKVKKYSKKISHDFLPPTLNNIDPYFQLIYNSNSEQQIEAKRRTCLGIIGSTTNSYKLANNYLVFQNFTEDDKSGILKYLTYILYLNKNDDLIVNEWTSLSNEKPTLITYEFKRE